MASIFDKWNKSIDLEGLQEDIREAEENGGTGEYREVPKGDYEVKIEKMELKESKKGDPMFTCWMRIIEGDYKKSCLFMNQVITQGFQIGIVNNFLKSLGTEIKVDFKNYAQYNDVILDIMEAIYGKCEFLVEYGENKGFSTFKIKEVYDI